MIYRRSIYVFLTKTKYNYCPLHKDTFRSNLSVTHIRNVFLMQTHLTHYPSYTHKTHNLSFLHVHQIAAIHITATYKTILIITITYNLYHLKIWINTIQKIGLELYFHSVIKRLLYNSIFSQAFQQIYINCIISIFMQPFVYGFFLIFW